MNELNLIAQAQDAGGKATPTIKPPATKPPQAQEAVGSVTVVPTKIDDPFAGKSLLAVGTKFINFLLAMIVIAAVITIVIAGFRMVTGGGNPGQITKAKKAIMWAIVGVAVALFSFGIVHIIQRFIDK
jgi:hypothetical protein